MSDGKGQRDDDAGGGVLGIGNTPRLFRRLVKDLGSISELLRSVPQMTEDVGVMARAVTELIEEMREMNANVEEMKARIGELQVVVDDRLSSVDAHVQPMVDDVHLMRQGVDDLSPKLEQMIRTLHPMRRTAERLGLRRRGEEIVLVDEPIEPSDINGDVTDPVAEQAD